MPAPNPLFLRDEALDQGIELLFFVQTGLVLAAKPVLERQNLSQAEHRALYLIERRPGVTLAELGAALGVTKQSLSRLVQDLTARGLVVQETTLQDRRKRLLKASDAARTLLEEVSQAQRRQLRLAFKQAGGEAVDGFRQVLSALLDEPGRRLARRTGA